MNIEGALMWKMVSFSLGLGLVSACGDDDLVCDPGMHEEEGECVVNECDVGQQSCTFNQMTILTCTGYKWTPATECGRQAKLCESPTFGVAQCAAESCTLSDNGARKCFEDFFLLECNGSEYTLLRNCLDSGQECKSYQNTLVAWCE